MNPLPSRTSMTLLSRIPMRDTGDPKIFFRAISHPFGTDEKNGCMAVPTRHAKITGHDITLVNTDIASLLAQINPLSRRLIPIMFSSFSLGPYSGNSSAMNFFSSVGSFPHSLSFMKTRKLSRTALF